jgi:hypothetical protein
VALVVVRELHPFLHHNLHLVALESHLLFLELLRLMLAAVLVVMGVELLFKVEQAGAVMVVTTLLILA